MLHLTFIQNLHDKLEQHGFNPKSWEIRSLATVDSTNNRTEDMLALYDKVVILSRVQTEGKGREGRVWYSPEGGMWLSVGINSSMDVVELSTPMVETVANVITEYVDCEVKKPNDILVNGKKICGILVETEIKGDRLDRIIVGIGINVKNDIPNEVKHEGVSLKDLIDKPPKPHELAVKVSLAVIKKLQEYL